MQTQHGIAISWDDAVVPYLLRAGGFNVKTGAGGLRKAIAKHIEAPMPDLILNADGSAASTVHLVVETEAICSKIGQPRPAVPR